MPIDEVIQKTNLSTTWTFYWRRFYSFGGQHILMSEIPLYSLIKSSFFSCYLVRLHHYVMSYLSAGYQFWGDPSYF